MSGALGRRDHLLAAALGVVLLAAAALGPTLVDARPAYEIPVTDASEDDDLTNASASAWAEVPAASLAVSSTGAAVPAAENVSVERVRVGAAQTDSRLYLRVSWADPTNDSGTGAVREFADAAAVQLPADAAARPPIAMGGTGNMVNVWYWSADGHSQELLAGGPGSTTEFNQTQITSDAVYIDGRWHVVFARSLNATGNRTAMPSDANLDVAVAVWNGSNEERSGRKAASGWYYLAMGPGPQGPPYEAILWAVAGLAIVLSALVTIEGVRRTRGE